MPYPYTRFYASILGARIECPSCGKILAFGTTKQPNHRAYRRSFSRLRCPACGKVYYLGLLLWDSPLHGDRGHPQVPADITPTRRQLAEIRNQTGGFWMNVEYPLGEPVNRYAGLGQECTCAPLPWKAECVIHGGQNAPKGEVEKKMDEETGEEEYDPLKALRQHSRQLIREGKTEGSRARLAAKKKAEEEAKAKDPHG